MDDMNGSEAGSGEGSTNGPATHRGGVILDCSGWREIYYYRGESIYTCCICGAGLVPDPEDEPHPEGAGRNLCGNCNRTKNFETMVGNE
jgi:hypothetical protein